MLRITPKALDAKLTLSLEGKLAGPWVAELAKAWSEWQGRVQPRDAVIDLRLVSFVDEAGRELLVQLHGEGCALLGSGCYVGPLVDAINQGRETGAATRAWCWLAALGLAAAGALAAGEAAPVLPLTLNQALHTALAENPEIHRSLLAIAQSQADRRSAAGALMPSLEASAVGHRARMNLDTELGSPTPGGPLIAGPYNWGIADLQASVPLFDLSLWDRWKASSHGEAVRPGPGGGSPGSRSPPWWWASTCAPSGPTEAVKAAQSRVDAGPGAGHAGPGPAEERSGHPAGHPPRQGAGAQRAASASSRPAPSCAPPSSAWSGC